MKTKIYNTEQYEKFPKEVEQVFKDLENGFDIEKNLNKIGYSVLDIKLDGFFKHFIKDTDKETVLKDFWETFPQYKYMTPTINDILWEEEEIESWKENIGKTSYIGGRNNIGTKKSKHGNQRQ